MAHMRVLIVEDEPRMADALRRGLRDEGYAVDLAADGEEALWKASATDYAAMVLDVMLPGMDGSEVCRRLRADEHWVPIVMLTARTQVPDRVAGLDAGADDYLAKPFSFDELVARLRALIRRGPVKRATVLTHGDLRMDPASMQVWRGDTEIELSPKEFRLLFTFLRRPGEVVTRYELLDSVWEEDRDHRSNIIDATIRNLREKIDRPFGTDSIRTVRGVGYRLCEPPPS
jgi:two-component system, OmpR family, response regulator